MKRLLLLVQLGAFVSAFSFTTVFAQVDVLQTAKVSEEQDFAVAYGLYRDGLFQFASEKFEHFLRKYPTSIKRQDALFLSIECSFFQDHFETALVGYDRFIQEYPRTRLTDDAYFRLGESYMKLHNADKARSAFKSVLDYFPSSEFAGEASYWIGESYVRQEEYDDALKYYQIAYENYPNNRLGDYSLYSIGWTYQRKHDYPKAVESYKKLINEFPDGELGAQAFVRIGECSYYVKDYRKSIEELTKAQSIIKREQEKGEAEYLIGEAYFHLEEYDKARSTYENFLRLYPEHPLIQDVKYALGWTYLKQGKFEKAIEFFDQLVNIDGVLGEMALYRKGSAQRLSGRSDDALKTWNEVSNRFPSGDYVDNALHESGLILYEGNKIKEAKSNFERVIKDFKQSDVIGDAYRMLGECLIVEGQFVQAKDAFEKGMTQTNASFESKVGAHYQFGFTLFKLKKYPEASKTLSEFLQLYGKHPKALDARYWLAESEYQRGNFSIAAREYMEVSTSPSAIKREEALYGSGWSFYKLHQFNRAIEQFERLAASFPNGKYTYDARLRIGDSHFFLKDYAKAAGSYRATIRLFSKQESLDYAYYQLGQTYYRTSEYDNAIQQFTSLLNTFPNSQLADDSQYLIGWIFFQRKQYSEAILQFQKLIRSFPNSNLVPRAYYSIGDANYNEKNYRAAETAYREMVNRYPDSDYILDAVSGIQYCLISLGKHQEALEVIDIFVRQHPSLASSEPLMMKKADLFFSHGEYERAATEYKNFADRFSRSSNAGLALYWAGKSLRKFGKMEEAAYHFEKAASAPNISPKTAVQSLIEAGEVLIGVRRFDRAMVVLSDVEKKYAGIEGTDEAIYLKGSVFVSNGDLSEARNQFSFLLSAYPKSTGADKARLALAKMHHAGGEYRSALQYAEQVSSSRTDEIGAEAQFFIGTIYSDRKEWQNAANAFLRVRYVYPRYEYWHAKALLGLAHSYEQLQETRKAREVYQAVMKFDKVPEAKQEAEQRLKNLDRQ